MDTQTVVFELADQHYGVNIARVEGIIKMQAVTGLPHAPSCLEGVTNLRGTVVPVISLRKRFSLQEGRQTDASRIVVVNVKNEKVGLVVDGVSQVVWMPEESVETCLDFLVLDVDHSFIDGIGKLDNQLIILLKLDRVLQIEAQAA